jgi:hypothetical protein
MFINTSISRSRRENSAYQFQYRDWVRAIVDDLIEGAGLDMAGAKALNVLLADGWTDEVRQAPGCHPRQFPVSLLSQPKNCSGANAPQINVPHRLIVIVVVDLNS